MKKLLLALLLLPVLAFGQGTSPRNVTSIGGATGVITLGSGLSVSSNTLGLTGTMTTLVVTGTSNFVGAATFTTLSGTLSGGSIIGTTATSGTFNGSVAHTGTDTFQGLTATSGSIGTFNSGTGAFTLLSTSGAFNLGAVGVGSALLGNVTISNGADTTSFNGNTLSIVGSTGAVTMYNNAPLGWSSSSSSGGSADTILRRSAANIVGIDTDNSGTPPIQLNGATGNITATGTTSTGSLNVSGTSGFTGLITGGTSIGVGTTTPNLLNGASYPGKVIHIDDNTQASFGVDTNGGYASFVLNDRAASVDAKLFEIDCALGAGKLYIKSGTDLGALLNTLMTFKPNGQVGIGATDPTSVAGTRTMLHILNTISTGAAILRLQDNNSGASGGIITVDENSPLRLWTNNAERIRIAGDGSVGIGTTAPTSTQHTAGSVAANVTSGTGSLTLTGTHWTHIYTGGTGTQTITLPTSVGVKDRWYCVKNAGTGTVTLATTSSQTIFTTATNATLTLQIGDEYDVVSNNANWFVCH